MPEHGLRRLKIGDHPVLHWPDGFDALGDTAEHFLGFRTDGANFLGGFLDGDYTGLTQDNAFVLGVHEGVCRSEVDADIVG